MIRSMLYVLSRGYGSIVALRNWAFDRGYFRRYYPPVPLVISIGNIVAGGTGKTPVTLMIAQEFYPHTPLAILSRGYKSRAEKLSTPVVLCQGDGPIHPAEYCGDEPYLLAQHLPKAHIIVGRNRYAASNMASLAGAQIILLDDGMQHRRLERDLEVIVVNALDAFGQGYFLPRGFLREELSELSRADLIIINRVLDEDNFNCIQEKLKAYSNAPAVGTRMEIDAIWDAKGNKLESLKDKQVGIFCGLAEPRQFQETIEAHGAIVVSHKFISDHETMNPDALEQFAKSCIEQGAEVIVCTEKDFVKLSDKSKALPIVWLQMRLVIVAGDQNWQSFIAKAKSDLARRI